MWEITLIIIAGVAAGAVYVHAIKEEVKNC